MADDWSAVARAFHYETEYEMLQDLYEVQMLTTGRLAELFGVSRKTILYHLERCGIDRRARGGANYLAHRRRTLYRMDQRLVYLLTMRELHKLTGADQSTIYQYRKRRRSKDALLHHNTNSGTETVRNAVDDSSSASSHQDT